MASAKAAASADASGTLRSIIAEDGVITALAINSNGGGGASSRAREDYVDSEHAEGAPHSAAPTPLSRTASPHPSSSPSSAKNRDAIKAYIDELDSMDYALDVFGMSVAFRADTISIIKRLIEALAVLLAVKLTLVLLRGNQVSLYVTAALVFLVYIVSQLTYHILHWMKWSSLQRKKVAVSDEASFERTPEEEAADAEATMWSVRMDEGELMGATIRDVLYLVNTFLTFVLVGVILEKLSPTFSDGQNLFEKIVELLLFVIMIFTVFACKGFVPSAVGTASGR